MLQTNIRVWLATRRVQRVRQAVFDKKKQRDLRTTRSKASQRRLLGGSGYEKRMDAVGNRVVARRGSGADIFEVEAGQVVESVWPKHWLLCSDEETGERYWYNSRTHESRWDAPPSLAGLQTKPHVARTVHEDQSWAAREDYQARTVSVTAGMYDTRQPRYMYERALINRRMRSGKTVKQQQALRERAQRREAKTSVLDRRTGAMSARQVAGEAGSRTGSRPVSASRGRRPGSTPRPLSASRQRKSDVEIAADNMARRAHMNKLCLPKQIANVLLLQAGAPPQLKGAYEMRPPSVSSEIVTPCQPVMPSEPPARPRSARPAASFQKPIAAILPSSARPASAGRQRVAVPPSASNPPRRVVAAGQGPLGRTFRPSSAPAPLTDEGEREAIGLRLEERVMEAAAREDYVRAEKLQARADAMRRHPGQSPQARSPRMPATAQA